MEDPLEYDLLPLPREITHRIVLASRKDICVSQLGNLRLLNKTWKAAIDGGLFGPHGRLMCSQKSTRFALLLGAPCGVNKLSLRPAVGLLDERCKTVYICPVPSENNLSFDGKALKPGEDRGIHISLLNRSIYILNEGWEFSQDNVRAQSTGCVRIHSFQSGESRTEYFEKEDRDSTLRNFATRLCFAGENRIFCVGMDVTPRASHEERVLSYEPRTRQWSLLPLLPKPEVRCFREPQIQFCYASEGRLYLFRTGEYDRHSKYDPALRKWVTVMEPNPSCYSHPLDGSQTGWKAKTCKRQIRDLFAKELNSGADVRLDPSSLQHRKPDGLMALLVPNGYTYDASDSKWVGREVPAKTPFGEKAFHRMNFRKFHFREPVTGVIPVAQLGGTGCLALGPSSALLLRDGEAQKPVNFRWRGELESGGFRIIWASAFPAEGPKGNGRTGGGGG